MLKIVIYDIDQMHNQLLQNICFRYSFQQNIDSEIRVLETIKEIKSYMNEQMVQSLIFLGTNLLTKKPESKEWTEWKEQYIVFLVDNMSDMLEVVTPTIRPSGLLLKPVEKSKIEHLLDEIWNDYQKASQNQDVFIVHIKHQQYIIPLSVIQFFESRNKKIVIRTMHQELEFYDTLGQIERKVSNAFLRTHKSFLVNMNQVKMISFPQMTIHFKDGSFALISRTYKSKVQEAWKHRSQGGM